MANSGDVRAVTSSLNDVNSEINKLLSLEESIDSLISSREVARDTGNHSVFVALDQELLGALARIDELESQIVAKLNRDIDFDKLDADKRMSFMLEENSDKALENEMLKVKLDHSFDEFISLQNQKQKDIDTLNNQKENLEKRLQELQSQAMPDSLEIGRTKRELEEINKKIERLQKEVEKMRSIANIQDPQDISKYIEKNNRIINNNFRNMKLKGIDQNNYAIATDLLAHLNDSDKIKAQYDHSSLLERQYDPFDDIMTPQEFQYLAKEYEIRNGKPFAYNRNARTGLLYSFFHKRDMEKILIARYPHLAKPENKKQLKEVLRRENDGLAVLLQSGITSDMMRNLYRDSELNIRNYQHNRGKREEWLNSIRLNNEPQQQPELQPNSQERNIDVDIDNRVSQPQNDKTQSEAYKYLQQCGLNEEQIKGFFDILNRQEREYEDLGFISRKPVWDNDSLIRQGIDEIMQEEEIHKKDAEQQSFDMDELPGVDFTEYDKVNQEYEEIHKKNAEQKPFDMDELPGVDFTEYDKVNQEYDEIHKKDAETKGFPSEEEYKFGTYDMPIDVIKNKKQADIAKKLGVTTIRELVELWNNDPESRQGFSSDAFKKVRKYANQLGAEYNFSMDKEAIDASKKTADKNNENEIDKKEEGNQQQPVEDVINNIEFDDQYVVVRTTVESNGKKKTLDRMKFDYTKDKTSRVEGILGEPKEKQEEQSNDEDDLER